MLVTFSLEYLSLCLSSVVTFNHRSAFPVAFVSSTIRQWWSSTLTFRVYCRPPTERMVCVCSVFGSFSPSHHLPPPQPFLVGKAVLPLRKWLTAHSFGAQSELDVRASTLADAVRGTTSDDPIVGALQVHYMIHSFNSLCTV